MFFSDHLQVIKKASTKLGKSWFFLLFCLLMEESGSGFRAASGSPQIILVPGLLYHDRIRIRNKLSSILCSSHHPDHHKRRTIQASGFKNFFRINFFNHFFPASNFAFLFLCTLICFWKKNHFFNVSYTVG